MLSERDNMALSPQRRRTLAVAVAASTVWKSGDGGGGLRTGKREREGRWVDARGNTKHETGHTSDAAHRKSGEKKNRNIMQLHPHQPVVHPRRHRLATKASRPAAAHPPSLTACRGGGGRHGRPAERARGHDSYPLADAGRVEDVAAGEGVEWAPRAVGRTRHQRQQADGTGRGRGGWPTGRLARQGR